MTPPSPAPPDGREFVIHTSFHSTCVARPTRRPLVPAVLTAKVGSSGNVDETNKTRMCPKCGRFCPPPPFANAIVGECRFSSVSNVV